MKLKPLHDRVLIKRVELETKTEGGLILGSEIEKDRDTGYGQVAFVGDGKRLESDKAPIPMTVKEGDLIAFNERIPIPAMYKGVRYYTLRESDIFFTIEDENVEIREYTKEDGGVDPQQARQFN